MNLLLLLVLVVCALGLVTSQHQSRKLFTELEREQERARALEVEYGQLQLEASTWGLHSRIPGLPPPAISHDRFRIARTHEFVAKNDAVRAYKRARTSREIPMNRLIYTPEHEMFREAARKWFQNEVAPHGERACTWPG